MTRKEIKKYPVWFNFVLFIIPVFIIIALEVILILSNFGNDYSTFVKISDQFENYKFFNPKLPEKYFGNSSITPAVIPDGFKVTKDKNTFRIFALGGSTTAGFPYPPNGSFPRLLKNKLNREYPDINFEVINLGISAVNSITIRDIIDDVLLEKPDLIIFYAGHNEYYGAMGPASNATNNYGIDITSFILKLKKFRTFQFVEYLIGEVYSIFSTEKSENKTLMSQMAGENLVELNSEIYIKGINQFKSNFETIAKKCQNAKVPFFVGTLSSNLLIEPLCKFSGCDSLVGQYQLLINNYDILSKKDFYDIKEKDALRFRAPEQFNSIIRSNSSAYKYEIFDIQQEFESRSKYGIIGDNLMLDHLHPNFEGNNIISDLILNLIRNQKILVNVERKNDQKNKLFEDFNNYYSPLDYAFANQRIAYLKNDFPFKQKEVNQKSKINYIINSVEDSLANEIIQGNVSWENAHFQLAEIYFQRKDYQKYFDEISVLIKDKPFDKFPYVEAIKKLEKIKKTELLKIILIKYYNVYPELFVKQKLADIYFSEKNYNNAIKFYKEVVSEVPNDARIYFNLSASYFAQKDLQNSLSNIQKCLKINPTYPNAQKIYNGLKDIYSSKK
ncbi:MAG: hypothetical protein H6610_09390 [Ignavibacteriales bacterium]|nr:hypothetical protein [Ignavibacteriales bacterium]MCB9219656.1 hypothetical protein [Ignavibacteriales bacterium]